MFEMQTRNYLSGIRAQVYTVLLEHPDGLTQSEMRIICQRRFGTRSESSYRKRLPELEAQGYAERTLRERLNHFGNSEYVWVAKTRSEA